MFAQHEETNVSPMDQAPHMGTWHRSKEYGVRIGVYSSHEELVVHMS